ncbi:protein translocase subunit SecDF, partial [Rhizobium brockwellii]
QPQAVVRSQHQSVVTLAAAAQSDAAVTELKTRANPISTGLSAGQADLAVTANGATIPVGFSPAGISANVYNAVQQSLEVIRQRVDQVGVSEPTI